MKTALNQLKEWLENATKQCKETYNATDAEKLPSTSISTYAMLSAYNMVLDQIKELLPTERETTESLKKEIDELRKDREWISVKDELPKSDTDVYAYTKNGSQMVMTFVDDSIGFNTFELYMAKDEVTHWMPFNFPPPPKTK